MFCRGLGVLILFIFPFLVSAETYFFSAPENGFANELFLALENAKVNDVFVLTSSAGSYVFEESVDLNQPIMLMAQENIENPTITVSSGTEIFNIVNNGSLEIISINLSTSHVNNSACISITNNQSSELVYTLTARNTLFQSNNFNAVNAGANTFGSSILFENCYFINSKCLVFNNDLLGGKASFSNLEFNSCVFYNCSKGAFYLSKAESSTHGKLVINHCVFDSVARNDTVAILDISGTSELIIKNSIFTNSTSQTPFKLSANAELDYCNFYRCNDLGSATGANCLYYNPKYTEQYFVGNKALYGKADDGSDLGILPWVYKPHEEDTVDTGDNPHGFVNQGVWVVPKPNAEGRWQSYFLKYENLGKLKYKTQENGDQIPDFSFVGYKMGNEEIPKVPVVATIYPHVEDATTYIQNVIDSVVQLPLNSDGFRGTILIKAGTYHINSTLFVKGNGIVIRGEKTEFLETVLLATTTTKNSKLINIGNTSGTLTRVESTIENITVPYIPSGAKYVVVSKDHNFQISDHVCITQEFNDDLITDLKMNQIQDDGSVSQWKATDYRFNFERKISRISSGVAKDSIFFYNPLVMALDAKYNAVRQIAKCSFSSRIQNCGIENITLKSNYASDNDENHAWDAVYFDRAEDCWGKNVKAQHFAFSCVNVSSNARFITVSHCSNSSPKSEITGGRRYSFNCNGQTSLFEYCTASEGRHDFVTGARVCGPNVFTFCEATKASNDVGPHHRWAVGTLYDNVTTDFEINIRDRGNMGTGHGWAGANQVLWNCTGASAICQNPWVYAKNYNIGFSGEYEEYTKFGNRPRGEWDGNNVKGLKPGSLYYAQRYDNGLIIDFGFENNFGSFVNDSVFRLHFNQPINETEALNTLYYFASGTTDINGRPQTIKVIDSVTVELRFKDKGFLIFNEQVKIKVEHLTSASGQAISGISECIVVVPDLRPKVKIHYQEITNAAYDFAEVASSKDGKVYILISTQKPLSYEHINELVQQGHGSASETEKDVVSNIATADLAAGYYYAYATDVDGRLSDRGEYGLRISDAIHILDNNQKLYELYCLNKKVYINLLNVDLHNAHVEIYDPLGKAIYRGQLNEKNNVIPLESNQQLLVVCLVNKGKTYTQKLLNL